MRLPIHRKLTAQLKPNRERRKTACLFKQIRKGLSNVFDHYLDTLFSFDLQMIVPIRKLFEIKLTLTSEVRKQRILTQSSHNGRIFGLPS